MDGHRTRWRPIGSGARYESLFATNVVLSRRPESERRTRSR